MKQEEFCKNCAILGDCNGESFVKGDPVGADCEQGGPYSVPAGYALKQENPVQARNLLSLTGHNKSIIEAMDFNEHRNGIACPKCGAELVDSCPDVVLTSCPAQYQINCVECNFTGTRF